MTLWPIGQRLNSFFRNEMLKPFEPKNSVTPFLQTRRFVITTIKTKLSRVRYPVWLGVVVVTALAHKLIYLTGFTSSDLTTKPFIQPDSRGYYEPALTLAQSFQYHSYSRTPGYPALLALIYRATQDYLPVSVGNVRLIFAIQILLTSLGCIPLALAILRLTGRKNLSLLAALLWAVHNAAMYYSTRVLTEALAAGLMCWLVYFVVMAETTRRKRWFIAECLTLIVLILIRPSFALMPIPLALAQMICWWFGAARPRKPATAFLILGFVLVLPCLTQPGWALRNRLVEGDAYYCRLSTFGFWAYTIESAIDAQNGNAPRLADYHEEFDELLLTTNARQMDALYRQRILQRLKSEPVAVLKYFAINSLRLIFPRSPDAGYKPALSKSFWTAHPWQEKIRYLYFLANSFLELATTLACIFLVGLAALRVFRSPGSGFLLISLVSIIYWWLIHANANAASRFLMPLQPLLLVAAGSAYTILKGSCRQYESP